MFFRSLAFLTIIALFSSPAKAAAINKVWKVTVGNATGATIFTPNYIVSKSPHISHRYHQC
jgi:hypothetical protein